MDTDRIAKVINNEQLLFNVRTKSENLKKLLDKISSLDVINKAQNELDIAQRECDNFLKTDTIQKTQIDETQVNNLCIT